MHRWPSALLVMQGTGPRPELQCDHVYMQSIRNTLAASIAVVSQGAFGWATSSNSVLSVQADWRGAHDSPVAVSAASSAEAMRCAVEVGELEDGRSEETCNFLQLVHVMWSGPLGPSPITHLD